MIIETHYFPSFWKAANYYSRQMPAGSRRDAVVETKCKIADGEIAIGQPTLNANQRLVLLDNGTRYGIEEISTAEK